MAIINKINEKDLIERFINGDQTAFELLFRFYYPGLVVFAQQIIMDHNEAEELVQDFFVKVWVNRSSIRTSDSLKNYCFTSIKNRAVNFLKKERITERIRQKLQNMVENDTLYQADLFIESEIQANIKKAFEKLPSRTAQIFKLSRFSNLSNSQIAEQLDISKRTVETHISNALKILKEELKEYSYIYFLLFFN